MNMLAASNFSVYLKNVFADWAIALFIFFAVLIVLAVIFKGLKVGFKLFVVAAVIAGCFVLAAFINMLVTWDTLRIIDFAIKWGPTILFVSTVAIYTLVNAKRGLRKSLILLAHATIAGVICLVFFYVCSTAKWVDKGIVTVINLILKTSGNSLQGLIGVSSTCATLREILAELLPGLLTGDLQILISENTQYIITLADLGFRLIFALIALIMYYSMVFWLYILYFFAYPERRYKKKVNVEVSLNLADRTYVKHHLGGGAVGLARGVAVGLLSLSFLGSALFVVAGGKGNGTLGDYDFENDKYNYYYSIYRSIDSYGSQGIFKILNSMTDAADTPYYLFAADLVFSGNLDSEEDGIDTNVKFREELAAFTGFAKDTINLLMKYGEEDIAAIINGNGGSNAFDTIVAVMATPEFRTEFDALIEEFKSPTYFINLGMSLVNSIVANIDEISFTSSVSADNRELLKLLFKKGFFSDYIPDEAMLNAIISQGILDASQIEPHPSIKVSHLITKNDARIILQVALSIMSGEQQTSDVMGMVKSFLPQLKQLSILQTSRSKELDPVWGRLYCYLSNRYLTADGVMGLTYTAVKDKNIKWIDEINLLLDVAGDALALWDNIYVSGKSAIDIAMSVFDADSPNYSDNVKYYDNISHTLEDSDIFGTVMSTSYMYNLLKSALSAVSKNIYIPRDLTYNRTVNADGSVTPGEVSYLFDGFKLLMSPENSELIDNALSLVDGKEIDTADLLDLFSTALSIKDENGNMLSTYFTESYLLRSVLSIVMIEKASDIIYVPAASLDMLESGEYVYLINKKELKQLLDNFDEVMGFVEPLLKDEGNVEAIADLLQNETFNLLIKENRIFEGTVAYFLVTVISGNDFVVIPQHLIDSGDGWVTTVTSYGEELGELRKLLNSIKLAEIDFAEIFEGEFDASTLIDTIASFKVKTAEQFFESEILHYTISKYLIDGGFDGFDIVVPNVARTKTKEGDTLDCVVKKSELIELLTAVSRLEITGGIDISSVLVKLVANKDLFDSSSIISASIVYTIVNSAEIKDVITIPDNYLAAGTKTALEDYNSANVWKAELPRFINALDEILGISKAGEDFVFDGDSLTDSLSELLTGLNKPSYVKPELSKLNICYLSDIARSEITVRLDDTLLDSGIVPENVLNEAKSHGYYRRAELQALSYALEIFEIDLLNLDSDEIIAKVTGRVFTLNDPLEAYDGQSALEVIYPSYIISYIISSEMDNALSDAVEADVLRYIRGGRIAYAIEDVASFIDAINEIGITDFDSMADFDLSSMGNLNDSSNLDSSRTRLDVIYSSRLAAGVITKSLYNSLNSIEITDEETGKVTVLRVEHSKAYEEGVRIYRKSEIDSLYYVFDGFDNVDLGNIDINQADLSKVSERLYDNNGITQSYLLASVISELFKNNENFIVPVSVLDGEGCIMPKESALIIEVFDALSEGKNMEDLENFEFSELPTGETRVKMFSSKIIRACVTYDLAQTAYENGQRIYASNKEVTREKDINGKTRYIISEAEFTALANALDAVSDEGTSDSLYDLPTFTLERILSYDKATLEILLKSDVMYFRLSDSLMGNEFFLAYLAMSGNSPTKVEAWDIYSGILTEEKTVVSREIINAFHDSY